MRRLISVLLLTTALGLSACDSDRNQPRIGSLTQHLTMVDSSGKIYGTVELDPINGGKVYDAEGRLIGRVVTPATPTYAPGVQ